MISRIAALLVLALLVAACGGATDATPSASPTDPPDAATPGPDWSFEINPDGPTFVEAMGGTRDPAPVQVEELAAEALGDNTVKITAVWTSGVEPCVLTDSVIANEEGSTITVTVLEGGGPPDIACIMIAVQKATEIEVRVAEPGEYTIVADPSAGAEPVTVTITD